MPRADRAKQAVVALVLALAVPSLPACSTIAHLGRPTIDLERPDTTKATPPDDFSLGAALLWAEAKQQELEKHADAEAAIPRWLGIALIPLGAAVAGLGIAGTTGAPVVALSLAGGTAAGVGGWLYSSQRQRAYEEGARGIECVIDVMRPLHVPPELLARFEQTAGLAPPARGRPRGAEVAGGGTPPANLAALRIELQEALSAVRDMLPTADALKDEAEAAIAYGEGLLAQLTVVSQRAREARARIHEAPRELYSTVRRTIGLVNAVVRSTAPDMEALRRQLALNEQRILESRLTGPGYRRLLESAPKDKTARTESVNPAREAILQVYRVGARLDAVYTPVVELLDRVAATAAPETCLQDARTSIRAEPLAVTPTTRELKPGESVGLTITGGEPGYTVEPIGTAKQAFRVGAIEGAGTSRHVVVTVTAQATSHTYALEVRDSRSGRVPVYVTVQAAEARGARVVGAAERAVKTGRGNAVAFRIEGGTAPYQAQGSDAVTASIAEAGGTAIVSATLTDRAKGGQTHSIVVRDQGGKGSPVVLTVTVID